MNTIVWELMFLSAPKTIHYCKKCGARTEHISSESFRINAQQKSLDVWLIYRCARCKTTWNLTILSRVSPKSIGHGLLEKLSCNDGELARQYAMDKDILKRNGAETELPPYDVTGDEVDLASETRVRIVSLYPLGIRVSKILREKLSLPKKTFDEMVQKGIIRLEDGSDIMKCRLNREVVVLIVGSDEGFVRQEAILQN